MSFTSRLDSRHYTKYISSEDDEKENILIPLAIDHPVCLGPRVDQGPLTTHHHLHRSDADEACCWGSTALHKPAFRTRSTRSTATSTFLPASSIYNITTTTLCTGATDEPGPVSSRRFPTYPLSHLPLVSFSHHGRVNRDPFHSKICTAPGGPMQTPFHTLSMHLCNVSPRADRIRHTWDTT